jgi:hypothetical protein
LVDLAQKETRAGCGGLVTKDPRIRYLTLDPTQDYQPMP